MGPASRRDLVRLLPVVGTCVLLWILRRPHQLLHPYVWGEEGSILRGFIENGWAEALDPPQGYLILPANVLVPLAAQISFPHLPWLMYLFALLVFVATVMMIVLPESRWGGSTTRTAMAVTASLVPVNPEVFGVLLYSFWWSTLWPLIILGWKRSLWLLRAPLLAVAALSSPAGGALFVVFAFAYIRGRAVRDAIGAGILLAGFLVQLMLMLGSPRSESISTNAPAGDVVRQVLRTGGYYENNGLAVGHLQIVGLLVLSFLLLAALYLSVVAKRDEALLMTVGAFVFMVLSSLPAPLLSNPVNAGPRYFFLPFVAFSWTLLCILRDDRARILRIAAGVLLCVSFFNLANTFSRSPQTTTARLSWKVELKKCAQSDARLVRIPVYLDGSLTFWSLDLSPSECRRLLS
jgi:hypothetical protein